MGHQGRIFRSFYSVHRMMHLTLVKWGFPAFSTFAPISNVKAELHFKMQVIHIVDVLGGRH
jgi:hypothetical protein